MDETTTSMARSLPLEGTATSQHRRYVKNSFMLFLFADYQYYTHILTVKVFQVLHLRIRLCSSSNFTPIAMYKNALTEAVSMVSKLVHAYTVPVLKSDAWFISHYLISRFTLILPALHLA